MKKFSIRTKILISLISLTVFLSILISFGIYFYLGNILVNEKKNNINQSSIEQVHESTQIIEKDKIFTKMLGTRTEPRDFLLKQDKKRGDELLNVFSNYAKEDNKYLAIYLLDKNGIGLVSTDPRFIGQDYSFRDYFKKALSGLPWIDVAMGKTSNQFGYYFSYPVKNINDSVLGVLVVKISNKETDDAILNSEVSSSTTVMLVDQYGIVLVSSKPERFLKSLGQITPENKEIIKQTERLLGKDIEALQYENIQKMIDKNETGLVDFYDSVDKETEVILINKFKDFPFYLVSEIGVENTKNAILSTVIILILFMIIIIFLFSFLIYRFISIFVSPLKKFNLISESIGKGDFSKRIDLRTKDEFGVLANSFNTMAESLENSYKNLDQKVLDQTKEINLKSNDLEEQKSAILNILEDVEKEKDKIELLSRDLEKFKLAVENASDQIVITNIDGTVIYGNNAVERITGFKPEEALGKKAGALWKIPMPIEYYQNMWDVIKNQKKTFKSEIRNRRKNGELYIADLSISPVLDKDNNIIYFVAIEHDITERKEAEEQIRKVLNDMQEQAQSLTIAKAKDDAILIGIGEGVITTNQDGIITLVNDSALDMLGYERSEVLDKPVIDVLRAVAENDEIIPLNRRPMVIALSTGEKSTVPIGSTYYYYRKDGSKFPAGITVTPFMLDGKIVGTIEVFRDITLEKDVDRAKTEFVSLASHQLRTPLTSIGWYSEMLLSGDAGELNDQQREYLKEVYDGNRRMVDLVSSLLNVSRIELGTFAVEPEMTDITEIAKSVIDELKLIITEKKMQVNTNFEENLGQIKIDKKLIRIVFQNLLTNALKYTKDGGKIDLDIKTKENDIFVSVADNGYGIPQGQQADIFKKLFRADNAKTLDTNGTGLGLYIIKSIVEQSSGGQVWFESTENKGTTFFFTLPKTGMKEKRGSKPLS